MKITIASNPTSGATISGMAKSAVQSNNTLQTTAQQTPAKQTTQSTKTTRSLKVTMADSVDNKIKTIDGRKHYKYDKDGSAEIDTDSKYYVKPIVTIPPLKPDRELIFNSDNLANGNNDLLNRKRDVNKDGPFTGEMDIANPYDPRVKHIRDEIKKKLMKDLEAIGQGAEFDHPLLYLMIALFFTIEDIEMLYYYAKDALSDMYDDWGYRCIDILKGLSIVVSGQRGIYLTPVDEHDNQKDPALVTQKASPLKDFIALLEEMKANTRYSTDWFLIKPFEDKNHNGIPDYLEEDLNNNGIPDYLE